jgi:hypothetical protein
MKKVLSGLIICFSLFACSDELDFPDARGGLVGYVSLLDTDGRRVDPSDISVEILGRVSRKTTTDDKGKFYYLQLPAGNYKLRITRNGYDPYEGQGIQHLGGTPTVLNTPDQSIVLAQKPEAGILSSLIQPWNSEQDSTTLGRYLRFVVEFDQSEFERNPLIAVFISDQPGVSETNYQEVFITEAYTRLSPTEFDAYGFMFGHRLIKGQTYYGRVFVYNGGTPYSNPETGKLVVPSLGASGEELSFISE